MVALSKAEGGHKYDVAVLKPPNTAFRTARLSQCLLSGYHYSNSIETF